MKNFFQKRTHSVYIRTIRKLLPVTGFVKYNGVAIFATRSWDKFFYLKYKKVSRDIVDYESGIVEAIQKYVAGNDTIVVIGGGVGVTVVKALQKIGANGKLYCYEGAKEYCKRIKWTIDNNKHSVPPGNIHILNNFVGQPDHVYGKSGTSLGIENIPSCDVLELDCEGSEKQILTTMTIRPRVIIVETHGLYNSGTTDIKDILKQSGYKIVSEKVAEQNHPDYCLKRDIKVLCALRND